MLMLSLTARNTIGFKYWLVRFLCQCCFFLLVVITVLMQAYNNALQSSEGLYIAIISCSAVFLYLEFIQGFKGWTRYFNSMYNIVDLLAFGFPLAAAINQLLILRDITSSEEVATQLNSVLFGFSVPLLSLHFLFELRVLKTVSQFVVIITRIIGRIRVFFIIFFAGLVAFTIAILHGGRYDPINDDLDSDNWAFQMLMIVYFFFTVILMLNVLIALLNVAFNNGDVSWHQVWLRNRMRVIESAENMSHQIPGFRKAHNWFPKEIYYSVTHEQAKAYKKRWVPEGESKDDDALQDKGVQAVILPGEAGVDKTTMNSSNPGPATPSSKASQSSTPVPSETSTMGDSAASPSTQPAVAPITVGELDMTMKQQDASLRSQFEELKRQMQLQQTSFEGQIEKMDARFHHMQESSNEQIRLLVEHFTRLNPTMGPQFGKSREAGGRAKRYEGQRPDLHAPACPQAERHYQARGPMLVLCEADCEGEAQASSRELRVIKAIKALREAPLIRTKLHYFVRAKPELAPWGPGAACGNR
ncbi:MAG: hypothetical protein J3R72DRAFT_499487 [Linnemannia gamsii]|nr:MAG: hypothetical protein J3R72DRAFT_499487 [Linnemannia gamsii]